MGTILCLHGPPGCRITDLFSLFEKEDYFAFTHSYKSFTGQELLDTKIERNNYRLTNEFLLLSILATQELNVAISFPTFFKSTKRLWGEREKAKLVVIYLTADFPYLLAHDTHREYLKILENGYFTAPIPEYSQTYGDEKRLYHDYKINITNKTLTTLASEIYDLLP